MFKCLRSPRFGERSSTREAVIDQCPFFLLIKQNDRPLWFHYKLIWTRDGRDSGLWTETGEFDWKTRFSIPKKKKKKTQRELHTRAHKWKQTHVHWHTYTPWHHKSALWHHQHWLLTCGFVFSLWLHQQLFVLESTNVCLSLSFFLLFFNFFFYFF